MPIPLDRPIHFSRRKILYILANLSVFEAGIIPDYRITGYTSAEHTAHAIKAMAAFIPGVEMATEATLRVSRAGTDGDLVMAIYADGWEAHKIARLLRCEERDVWRRVSRALRYASDDDCLIINYADFKNSEREKKRHGR